MKRFFGMLILVLLVFTLMGCSSISADLNADALETVQVESTDNVEVRLSTDEANDLFNEEFDKFINLLTDLDEAINFYNENDFTTLEDIENYEAMWQKMANTAKEIEECLLENRPPEKYEENWDAFANCMGKMSTLFARCTDMNTNHDDVYTGDEMATLLREVGDEVVNCASEANGYAEALESTTLEYAHSSNNTETGNSHSCVECGKNAPKIYTNPFSGELEYYCTQHYEELMDMLEELGLE